MQNMRCCLIVFIICFTLVESLSAEELHYPPLFDGRIDFSGERYSMGDDSTRLYGFHLKRPIMKEQFFILKESRKYHEFIPEPRKMYLVRIKKQTKVAKRANRFEIRLAEGDTLIRQVKTLHDLRGIVKIRTETDALEFVRLGSNTLWSRLFEPRIEEVFCIRTEDSKGVDFMVDWGTTKECQMVGFHPPVVVNLTPKRGKTGERESEKHDDNQDRKNNDDDDDEMEDEKEGSYFHVTRTVYSMKDNFHQFLRVTEEVGPEGQWRLLSEKFLAKPNAENDLFGGVDRRPENRGRPLNDQEKEEMKKILGAE